MSKFHAVVVKKKTLVIALVGVVLCAAAVVLTASLISDAAVPVTGGSGAYTILAMNDIGMHCIQPDYSGFLLLPPANTLKVQVIQKGTRDARLVSSGIRVTYEMVDNTTSDGKTNFWKYAKDYGYDVAPNVGITGNGLKGEFTLSADGKYYEAAAIPVTPYNDGNSQLNPYQLAHIRVLDARTGEVLAEASSVVVPVSDEMDCGICHGQTNTDFAILTAHDKLSGTSLVKNLQNGQRYKCGQCHKDNALGLPGKPDVLPLSQAIHSFHADKMAAVSVSPLCYSCHPGPVSQCYRGQMALADVSCDSDKCHGDMTNIAQTQAEGRQAWLDEPDCSGCHGEKYAVNPGLLYRNSYLLNSPGEEMNGLILCESCHNSPHAEWVSAQAKDNLLPHSLLGYDSFIDKCTVCHEGEGKVHQNNSS
jgi:hypothetical protein